jgi:hypothetical protein
MNWSRDYSNLGQVCPEKALLRALTDSTEKTDFDLYYEYFKKFKLSHSHVNLQGNETRPNRAEKMARTKLFNLTQPDRPPAFLDLSNWAVSVIFFTLTFVFALTGWQFKLFLDKIFLIFSGLESSGPVGQRSSGLLLDDSGS